jgi:hypothetical protein
LSNRRDINPNGIQVRDRIRLIHIHDVHADVREGEICTVRGLSTVSKYSHSNELDLIIWIEWDHSKSSVALTEGVDQYEILKKSGNSNKFSHSNQYGSINF